jgi:hypothetical protein
MKIKTCPGLLGVQTIDDKKMIGSNCKQKLNNILSIKA